MNNEEKNCLFVRWFDDCCNRVSIYVWLQFFNGSQTVSTLYISPDSSYSFTLPAGFKEKEEAASQVAEGATGTAFSNGEGVVLGVVSTKPDPSVKTEDVTLETVEQQVRATYPEAQIENFRNEKKGNGQILSYTVKVTANNVTSILARRGLHGQQAGH